MNVRRRDNLQEANAKRLRMRTIGRCLSILKLLKERVSQRYRQKKSGRNLRPRILQPCAFFQRLRQYNSTYTMNPL
jgi:hypothetical protein